VVMPTGGGKTILFADVIRRVFPRRALVLAHREELIFQARDKIQRVTGLRADVEMGEYKAEGGLFDAARVIVRPSRRNAPAATAADAWQSSTRNASACSSLTRRIMQRRRVTGA